jgi:hypothetical protein
LNLEKKAKRLIPPLSSRLAQSQQMLHQRPPSLTRGLAKSGSNPKPKLNLPPKSLRLRITALRQPLAAPSHELPAAPVFHPLDQN